MEVEETVNDNGVGWNFPLRADGTRDGFNVAALDMFKSERLQAVVREMLQNSLDAREYSTPPGDPVQVRFTLRKEHDLESAGFLELREYFQAALDIEPSPDGKSLYSKAIESIDSGAVTMLGVHDYRTIGLGGPTEDPPSNPQQGAWLALVKGAGVTFKQSSSALGSFGHGSRAPFAMSEMRTLFYLTRVRAEGSGDATETRFQGKSILQSIPLNSITGDDSWASPTGYFGIRDGSRPLLNDAIPGWATGARPAAPEGVADIGTSIFIPQPFGVEKRDLFWKQVKLAVVANFYYAVLQRRLEVMLDDEVLDHTTIAEALDVTCRDLDSLGATDKVRERLESAQTVRLAVDSGALDVPGFGAVDWFLRFDGMSSRKVGVARGNGMLITRQADKLQRFPGTRPFDLFICVTGERGSSILRKLENPEHTEFSPDRINDPQERQRAKTAYADFTAAIRALVKQRAEAEKVDAQEIDDLDDFFRVSGDKGGDSDSGERDGRLRLSELRRSKHRTNAASTEPGTGEPGGQGGAEGVDEGAGSNQPGSGSAVGTGAGRLDRRNGVPVEELRIVPTGRTDGEADVSFTPRGSGSMTLRLLRSGESQESGIQFRVIDSEGKLGEPTDSIPLSELNSRARKRVRLLFDSADLNFAIEGRLSR